MELVLWHKIALTLGTAIGMEGVAWWAHKYVMHGWGWAWHKDHHEPHDNLFEKNDLYAVVFSILSMTLFLIGTFWVTPLFYVALGILIYGIVYTVFHDGLIHQRYPWKPVPKKGYFKRVVQAHKVHHARIHKDDCVSFGFVFALDPQKLHKKLMAMKAERQPSSPVGEVSAEG